jgi:hypothetical protein
LGYGGVLSIADIAAAVCLSLGVAVRAQETEVPESIVVPTPVDVIELERYRLAVPLCQSTALTPRLLDSLTDEALLEPIGIDTTESDHEDLVQPALTGMRVALPAKPRLAEHVTRIQAELCDPAMKVAVVATRCNQSESAEGFGNRYGVRNRSSHFLVRRASTTTGQVVAPRQRSCWGK